MQLQHKMEQQARAASQPTSAAASSSSSSTSDPSVVLRSDPANDEQVAVVDVAKLDWWTFINKDKANATNTSLPTTQTNSSKEVDDEWQLVDNDEFVQALSDFIAQTMKNNVSDYNTRGSDPGQTRAVLTMLLDSCLSLLQPDVASKLPPDQLRRMLTDVFVQVKQPNTSTKLWQWGTFAYHTYSW